MSINTYFQLNSFSPSSTFVSRPNRLTQSDVDFLDLKQFAEFFRYYNSNILNKTFKYSNIDNYLFTDYFDITGYKNNEIKDEMISYRLNDIDGFDIDNLAVLVFGHEGTLIKKEDYYYRIAKGSLHVFVRKFRKSDNFQHIENNKPVTIVALNYTNLDYPRYEFTVPANTPNYVYTFSKQNYESINDIRYIDLQTQTAAGINSFTNFFMTETNSDISITINPSFATPRKFFIIDKSEDFYFTLNYKYDKCSNNYKFETLVNRGCNISVPSVNSMSDLRIELTRNINNINFPLKRIEPEDILVFLKGNKLLANIDYTIERNDSKQFIKLNLDIEFTDSNEISVFSIKPRVTTVNNNSLHVNNINFDISNPNRMYRLFSVPRATTLGVCHSMFIFSDRRLIPLDDITVLDDTLLFLPTVQSNNNLEFIFSYMTNKNLDLLIDAYLSSNTQFQRFLSQNNIAGNSNDLRTSAINSYISARGLTAEPFPNQSSIYNIAIQEFSNSIEIDKITHSVVLENTNSLPYLPLSLVSRNDIRDRILKFYNDEPSTEWFIEHKRGHNNYVIELRLNSGNKKYSIINDTSESFSIVFDQPEEGYIIVIFDYLNVNHLKVSRITNIDSAPNNSYYGTDQNGVLGIWPLPSSVELNRPEILNSEDSVNITKDLKVTFTPFSTTNGLTFNHTLLMIKDSEIGVVVYSDEYISDNCITLNFSLLMNILKTNRRYEIYVKHFGLEGISSPTSDPFIINTQDSEIIDIVPKISDFAILMSTKQLYVNGSLKLDHIDSNEIIFTHLQISNDSEFKDILFDNIIDRNLYISGGINVFDVKFRDLPFNTDIYLRMSYEFKTGNGRYSVPLKLKTVKGLLGFAQLLNHNISLENAYTQVLNDKVYVYVNSDVFIFNTLTNTFSLEIPLNEKPVYRENYHIFKSSDTTFILSGGEFNGLLLNDIWEYNIALKRWTNLGSLPYSAKEHRLCKVNDKLYIFGGETSIDFQSSLLRLESNGSWTVLNPSGDKPVKRSGHLMVGYDNYILLASGKNNLNLTDTWIFNISLNKWSKIITMPLLNSHYNSIVNTRNNLVYTFGGTLNNDTIDKLVEFDFNEQSIGWKKIELIGSSIKGLFNSSSFFLDDELYLFGGRTNANNFYNLVKIR